MAPLLAAASLGALSRADASSPVLIRRIPNIGEVMPPQTITVTMTMSEVVDRMTFCAGVVAFRIASAKAIAPRRPENIIMC